MERILKSLKNKIWQCPERVYKTCEQFAESCVSTVNYSHRGQTNKSKIQKQIVYGKVAEFAVSELLKGMFLNCSDPDLKIYGRKEKSFDSDLRLDEERIHVKTQDFKSVQKYGEGWMFQKRDPIITNPSSHDWIVLTIYDQINKAVKVVNVIGAGYLMTELPKVIQLRHTKLVILPKEIKVSNKVGFFLCKNMFEIGLMMDVKGLSREDLINVETLPVKETQDERNLKVWYFVKSEE